MSGLDGEGGGGRGVGGTGQRLWVSGRVVELKTEREVSNGG